MAQSLAGVFVHLVFSTKNRQPIIREAIRSELHAYCATVLKNLGCGAVIVNSVDDHVHILALLGKQVSLSELVGKVKTASSAWIKRRDAELAAFAWQSGYAAFSVSPGDVASVKRYVASQQEHHGKIDFKTELRDLLAEAGVSFDERFLWD